jgi:hypothetical protein
MPSAAALGARTLTGPAPLQLLSRVARAARFWSGSPDEPTVQAPLENLRGI